jgi:hypothetical protein
MLLLPTYHVCLSQRPLLGVGWLFLQSCTDVAFIRAVKPVKLSTWNDDVGVTGLGQLSLGSPDLQYFRSSPLDLERIAGRALVTTASHQESLHVSSEPEPSLPAKCQNAKVPPQGKTGIGCCLWSCPVHYVLLRVDDVQITNYEHQGASPLHPGGDLRTWYTRIWIRRFYSTASATHKCGHIRANSPADSLSISTAHVELYRFNQ